MQRTATTIGLILGGGLLFVAGVAAGWQVGRVEQPVAGVLSDADLLPKASVRPATIVPRAKAPVVRADGNPVSRRALERLALLTELNRRLRFKFAFSPVDFDPKLNEDFARIFDVTPAERQEFESAIADADAELARTAASIAQIESRADGTFTISIPPFPDEGGKIYDRFITKVAGMMGPERTSYLQEMGGLDHDRMPRFERFGVIQTNLELNPSATGHQSSGSFRSGDATGVATQTVRLDVLSFRQKYPLIYEKMRAAGQLPDLPVP